MIRLFLCWILLSLPLMAEAEENRFGITQAMRDAAKRPEVDLNSRIAVEFALLDDPNAHIPWLQQRLKELDPDKDPVAWTRACWALVNAGEVDQKVESITAQCIKKAEELKLYVEWSDLSYNQFNFNPEPMELADYEQKMQTIIDKVRTFQDPDALAFMLSYLAIDLMRYKILDRSLPLLSEAAALIETPGERSLMAFNYTKNAITNSLRYRELHTEAITADRAIAKLYSDLGLRLLASRIRYALGFSLLFQEQPDYQGARDAVNSALQMSREIGDRSLQGSISSILALVHSHYGEHDDAVRLAREAVKTFVELQENITLAYAEKRLAEVLVAKGDYANALVEIEAAQKQMIDQNQEFKKDLQWFRYKSLAGLHDKGGALEALVEYNKTSEELAKQRAKNEYNRAAASLGLKLEQVKTKTLEQENRLQSQQLEEAERIRRFTILLAALSLSTLGFLALSLLQVRKVKASKSQMHRILENIDEGLLTIDGRQKIGRDYSTHLQQIVGANRKIAGQDFVSTVLDSPGVPNEKKSMVREILQATLHESKLAWELNADNLPQEININRSSELTFVLRWIPIFDRHENLEQLLVSLTDVTQARALEKALGARDKKLRALPETLREILALKPEHIRDILQQTEALLSRLEQGADSTALLRDLHTQKGLARTLGLRELSQDLHDVESFLQQPGHERELNDLLVDLHELVQEYRAFAGILHQERSAKGSTEHWLASVLEPHLATWRDHMLAAGLPLAEIQVVDAVMDWNSRDLQLIRDVCLHAINNSLDHGFVFPKQRGQILPQPCLRVVTRKLGTNLQLEISDNGAGLQLAVIEDLARRRGFVPGPGESITDVLFTDGFSSATTVTVSSGRGIGLAAVKARIQERGGQVHIRNHSEHSGSILAAEWPVE